MMQQETTLKDLMVDFQDNEGFALYTHPDHELSAFIAVEKSKEANTLLIEVESGDRPFEISVEEGKGGTKVVRIEQDLTRFIG